MEVLNQALFYKPANNEGGSRIVQLNPIRKRDKCK